VTAAAGQAIPRPRRHPWYARTVYASKTVWAAL